MRRCFYNQEASTQQLSTATKRIILELCSKSKNFLYIFELFFITCVKTEKTSVGALVF
jgi:hypothetical protein